MFKKIIRDLRLGGYSLVLPTLQSTRRRDWLDQEYIEVETELPLTNVGYLLDSRVTGRGMKFTFEQAVMDLIFLTNDMVCLAWEPGHPPPAYALARRDWTSVRFNHRKLGEARVLETDEMQVTVSPDGGVIFSNPDGDILREEIPPQRKGKGWIHHSLLQPESCLYGLGERAAPLNLRGGTYISWNADPLGEYGPGKDPLYLCIPVYIELHNSGCYLVFYENCHPGYFTLTETASATFQDGMLRYFFIPGPLQRALARFTELTGRSPVPPRWSLGYHQSRWGYKNEEEIRAIISGFKDHRMPISAIHLDIDHQEGFRTFTVNRKRFPNLGKLSKDLEQDGVKVIAIVNPGVKEDRSYSVYQKGQKGKFFCTEPDGKAYVGALWGGRSVFPDFTNPAARAWWADNYQFLINEGISGFWHDMNEPTSFSAWGDNRLPLPIHHNMEGQGADHRKAHNLYGFLMNRAGYEGILKHRPGKRPWILSRSGWAGSQRFAWSWTGDSQSSWANLQNTIPMILNLGLSGIPYSGPDIGGFAGNPSPELYTRWFQMATFMPFYRTHSAKGTDKREPWVFNEPTTSIVSQFLNLRYYLLPYLYTLAWEANQTGTPINRPIFWSDLQERRLWAIDDEFLLGDSLLIAPVVHENQTNRQLILPPGRWYDIWTGNIHDSHLQEILVKAPIERIPLFGRGGKIIPMDKGDGALTLLVFSPAEPTTPTTALQLYQDAGDGYPESKNDFRIDVFSIEKRDNTIILNRTSEGSYPFPYKAIRLHLFGFTPANVRVDNENVVLQSDGQILTWFFQEAIVEA